MERCEEIIWINSRRYQCKDKGPHSKHYVDYPYNSFENMIRIEWKSN